MEYNVQNIGGVIAINEKGKENEPKRIRFITSDCKDKFFVNDGKKVKVTRPDGSSNIYICKYIDEYHFFLGNMAYHICEFGEKCENMGWKVEQYYEPRVVPMDEIDLDENNDYIFKPGIIHGCDWKLYWLYFNPDGCEGRGCFEVCKVDVDTIIEADEATKSHPELFRSAITDKAAKDGCWYGIENDGTSTAFEETLDSIPQATKAKSDEHFRRFLVGFAKQWKEKNA